MNIKEVAARANVSAATVSRTINQSSFVKPETAERVRRAIHALGFYPNNHARALISGKSRIFGLIISDITNPFFPELVKSFECSAVQGGYDVIMANTDHKSERMTACVQHMIERKVDGIAIMTWELDRNVIQDLSSRRIPIVILDPGKFKPPISNIAVDPARGIREAVEHLVTLGHRNYGLISESLSLGSALGQRAAIVSCLRSCGILDCQQFIVEGNYKTDVGRTAMRRILACANLPTAVIASSDLAAIGALRAIHRVGLRVPEDISLVGFDDIEFSQFTEPALTTVRLSRIEVGRKAFDALHAYATGSSVAGQEIRIGTSLMIRESTGPLRSDRRGAGLSTVIARLRPVPFGMTSW